MNELLKFDKVYAGYNSSDILKGMSFVIREGDRTALIGNNGAGKTTALHILANLHSYKSGLVSYKGKKVDPGFVEYKRELGLLLSKPYYVEYFSIREYLSFAGKMYGTDRSAIEERIPHLTEQFSISGLIDKKISDLSSGEQMKVSIITSLIHDPKVLVYDEPFTYLDVGSVEQLKQTILEEPDRTLILASNNLNECLDICNTFLIIENGKVAHVFRKEERGSGYGIKEQIKSILTDKKQEEVEWI